MQSPPLALLFLSSILPIWLLIVSFLLLYTWTPNFHPPLPLHYSFIPSLFPVGLSGSSLTIYRKPYPILHCRSSFSPFVLLSYLCPPCTFLYFQFYFIISKHFHASSPISPSPFLAFHRPPSPALLISIHTLLPSFSHILLLPLIMHNIFQLLFIFPRLLFFSAYHFFVPLQPNNINF